MQMHVPRILCKLASHSWAPLKPGVFGEHSALLTVNRGVCLEGENERRLKIQSELKEGKERGIDGRMEGERQLTSFFFFNKRLQKTGE